MAFEITVHDVETIHDETDGLQNSTATSTPPGDADDNDIAVSELPPVFSERLIALGLDEGETGLTDDAIGAALSGYNGDNNGLDLFTVTTNGSTVNNLALTDVNGDLLDGDDSGLTTTAGDPIFLYTDPDNDNIVLGRSGTVNGENFTADPNGDIVFAIYLDGNETLTAGKLWTVQFEAIFHPDSGNDDDVSSSLTKKLYVSAARDLEFDLTNAPSGQNLFIMFGDGDISAGDAEVGIIATGKNPANESNGESITTGDTVNTSQGGGNTTFGINNQMIDEGEGIYFTFVKGPESNYTVPNLDQNEADIEANIRFNDFLGAKGAEFQVVQLQGGKTAVVTISAYNGSGEGVNFVDGLDNDVGVDITGVQVFESDGVTPATGVQVIDNNDGTYTIKGVEAGDFIQYSTDGDHNRVLIENTGTGKGKGSADFDIGGFQLVQGDITTAEIGSTVFWEDDGPSVAADGTLPDLVTDDTDITDTAGPTSFAALFTTDFGQDSFKDADNDNEEDADAVTYELGVSSTGVNSGLDDTLTGDNILLRVDADGNVEGYLENDTGTVAFEISVDADTGAVTLTQSRAIVHDDINDHDEANDDGTDTNDDAPDQSPDPVQQTLAAADVTLTATATDGDGDTAEATANIGGAFRFLDDGPAVTLSNAELPDLVTDDTDIPDSAGPTSFAALFTTDFGQDSFKDANDDNEEDVDAVTYELGVSSTGVNSGLDDTLTGDNILLRVDADGNVEGYLENDTGTVAFEISVDADTGAVTLTQSRAIVHDDINDHDEANDDGTDTNDDAPDQSPDPVQQTLAAADVTLTATATDGDGDTAEATANIGGAFRFLDDGPAVDFGNLVGTVTTTTQTGEWSETVGTDGFGAVTIAAVDTDSEADGIQFDMVTAGGVESTGTIDSFTFNAETGEGTGTLTADFDNDSTNGDETIGFDLTVNDDGTYDFALDEVPLPVVTLSTDEGQLPAGGPDPVQTLTFGGEDPTSFVFFAVDADTAEAGGAFGPTDIVPAIELDEPDLTEVELEAGAAPPIGNNDFPFIREEILMNVSTSGIGVNNNVLQGEDNPGDSAGTINAFDSGAFDESFVINPEPLASSVKVFISKTAGGFEPPGSGATPAKTDYLYYNVYDEDGNSVGPILVEFADVTDEGSLWSFTIDIDDLELAGNSIDAVQFTMGFGNIKIPKIEVVVKGNEPPNDIFLDFEATITDADGDSATNAFEVDLYAYDVISDTQLFDYTLADAGDGSDAFNAIDTNDATEPSQYLVEGFVADEDLLVLLNLADGYSIETGNFDGDGDADDSRITSELGQLEVVVKDATLTASDITEADTLI